MYPRLTTVGQNISERGEMAGRLILKIINNEQVEKENYMDCQIIEVIRQKRTVLYKSRSGGKPILLKGSACIQYSSRWNSKFFFAG